jgi:diketogulonate reductase-like aldo/keto reductase
MQFKTIGNSKVPAIGQGTQGIHDVKVIKRGIDLGMTFIDTAEVYKNEEIIGEAIKGQRDKVFISTKFSPEHNSYDDVIKSCDASLKRLDTDYIDLYSMHWPNCNMPLDETIRALRELFLQGKIKYFGVCNMNHKTVEGIDINAIQNEYSLFDRTSEEVFGHCEKHGITFVAYSPIQNLYYNHPSRMIWLQDISFKYGKTLAQVALNWIVSHKPVIAIPKSKSLEHQKLNATATDFTIEIEDLAKIDKWFTFEPMYIDPKIIHFPKVGKFPQTLEEAKQNKTNFVPSPLELAETLEDIKPVRVETRNEGFELVEGGLRYWAWVIKYGDKPIPVLVRELTCLEI